MQRNVNGGGAAAAGTGQPACAACKHQRKRCDDKCVLAPYFPADRAADFQGVQKVYGVSNVTKMVQATAEGDRGRLCESFIWESQCRIADPVLGSYGKYLRATNENQQLKNELMRYRALAHHPQPPPPPPASSTGWSYPNNGNHGNNHSIHIHAKVEPNGGMPSYRVNGNNNNSAGVANFPGAFPDNGNSLIDPSAYGTLVISNGQSRGFDGNHHQEAEAVATPVQAVPLPPQRRINGFNHQHQYHNHNGFSGT